MKQSPNASGKYVENWLKSRQSTVESSREKFTHKNIQTRYQPEEYLKIIRNP